MPYFNLSDGLISIHPICFTIGIIPVTIQGSSSVGYYSYDRPPILPPHFRPFFPLTFSPLLQRILGGQYRLPCRDHRYLDRLLAAVVFLPQPTRSVWDSSAGRLIVGSGRGIRGCFRRPAGKAMAGHHHLMREVVGIQGWNRLPLCFRAAFRGFKTFPIFPAVSTPNRSRHRCRRLQTPRLLWCRLTFPKEPQLQRTRVCHPISRKRLRLY